MNKVIYLSLLIFLIFPYGGSAEQVAILEELSRPEVIQVAGDQLFVIEEASVLVYSLKNYSLLARFGKRGEGPGELKPLMRYKLQLRVHDDRILVNSRSKLVIFDDRGKLISEKKFPFIVTHVMPLGENYAVTKSVFNSESGNNSMSVKIFNQDMKEITTTYSRDYTHFRKSGKMYVIPELVFIKENHEKLYVFDQKGDFEIHVFDKTGKPIKTIKVDRKKLEVDQPFMEKTWAWLKRDIRFRSLSEKIKRMVAFPRYFPHIKFFEVDQEFIYAHTYKYKGDRNLFLVIDTTGRVVKELYLPGAEINTIEASPYTFDRGRYIYLQETASLEKWALHIEKISK